MCTVSLLMEYGEYQVYLRQWTPDAWADFKDILKRLEVLDRKLDQTACDDPSKARWMQAVDDRLRRLESTHS